jgi:hypothetical protein
MELKLIRNEFSEQSTIGELSIDGNFFSYVLEDKDRGLKDEMTVDEVAKLKVYGKTCIPYGRYEILMTWSNKFQCVMPLVSHVKGYEGIRIHKGNTETASLGCLLVGMIKQKDRILKSTEAFDKLYPILQEACKKGKVYITIEKSQLNQIIH